MKKILYFAGTSETALVALSLAQMGCQVIISVATNEFLQIPLHSLISCRRGRLNAQEIANYIIQEKIDFLVDTTHPYAFEISKILREYAKQTHKQLFAYVRPEAVKDSDKIILAKSHIDAALQAFCFKKSVLLTTGSTNLIPYILQARKTKTELYARVLSGGEGKKKCLQDGLLEHEIIEARGPFSVEDNINLFEKYKIGVVVSKDSGVAGGFLEKMLAAEKCSVKMIVLKRALEDELSYNSIPKFLGAIKKYLGN